MGRGWSRLSQSAEPAPDGSDPGGLAHPPAQHRLPLHQHGSCRSFLLSDRTHASRQLLFQWGLAYEQGILFSEFLVKIFHLIKFLQPALLCVCQKVEARAALSSAPWEAGSRSLWGEPSPRRGAGEAGGRGAMSLGLKACSHQIWDGQQVDAHDRPHRRAQYHQKGCLRAPHGNLSQPRNCPVSEPHSPEPVRCRQSQPPLSVPKTPTKIRSLLLSFPGPFPHPLLCLFKPQSIPAPRVPWSELPASSCHVMKWRLHPRPDWSFIHPLILACSVTQSCPTLCDPMDCSPPGSSAHGIFQTRILEGVAISFSKGSS